MNAKSRLQSKTYWGVIVTAVVGQLGIFGIGDFSQIEQAALASFLAAVCILFASLRELTGAPLKGTDAEQRNRADVAEKVQRETDRRLRMAQEMQQGGGR